MKNRLCASLLLLAVISACISETHAEDQLLSILKSELGREYGQMKALGETVPYFMSYRVDDVSKLSATASLGSLKQEITQSRDINFKPMIRLGTFEMDNYRLGTLLHTDLYLPIDDPKGDATKMVLWKATFNIWKSNAQIWADVQSNAQINLEKEDKSDDYSPQKAVKYVEKEFTAEQLRFNMNLWEQRIKEYSAIFKEYPEIRTGTAQFVVENCRKYYVSTEGTEIVQNQCSFRLYIHAEVVADDGMNLPLSLSYFSYTPEGIKKHETILRETREMAEKLLQLRTAPIGDSYTGPAILSPEASGVFFHEIFGHRIEGQRLKNESDGQTFKKKVGELVLPTDISVSMNPTLRSFNNQDLNGSYIYDDEGVKGQKVEIVKNGILKGFLMSRVPINGFPASNGHGRAAPGVDPVTRQSNLIVTSSAPKTNEELRHLLKEEAKRQGKEYGYYFSKVSGGFTQTGRVRPNVFNVTPLEVYKVYVDGRPDELIRGVTLIGTPLSMFSQISSVGDKAGVFTGICGAESGSVPVSAISPELFVKVIETQRSAKSNKKSPVLPRPNATKKQ